MTTALAISAIAISLVAIGVSVWTGLFNKRSAAAAEKAEKHAKDSAEAAARVAAAEVERDHRDCHPRDSATEFTRESAVHDTHTDLWFTFTPARSYRVSVDLVRGEVRKGLPVPSFIDGHRPVRILIEPVTSSQEPEWDRLEFRFWPPMPGDAGETWTCPCGRTLDGSDERVHWSWSVPVEMPPPSPARPWVARF